MHRFEDAAFVQDALMHNIASNGYFARLCDGYQRSRYPEVSSGLVKSVMLETLMRADPIYVSDDVMTLWEHASKTFESEVVRRDDLVVPRGFALLPRPFTITDTHGKQVKYRALAWLPVSQQETFNWDEGVTGQGVWLSLISNIEDVDDYWLETHVTADGTPGAVIRDASLAAGQTWSLMHGSPVIFDESIVGGTIINSENEPITDPAEIKLAASIYTHVQCFWRLMSQLVLTPEPLPRQARRQRQRAQRIDTVKVMRLRRTRHRMEHEGEGPGVEYSHRWVVEGHWRNQPYGPKSARYYKQIWISPYVKGPDDKPLVVKDRGIEFTR